jgi:hypothetical protein
MVIYFALDRDSVLQFIAACQGVEFSLALLTVFEMVLLWDEWSLGKSIHQTVRAFVGHPPSGQSFWSQALLFRLGWGRSPSI